jgi:hypothetical protein
MPGHGGPGNPGDAAIARLGRGGRVRTYDSSGDTMTTHSRKLVRPLGAAVVTAAAAATTIVGAASPAAAASVGDFVQLLPYPAPRIDVAQGAGFATVARDSSGISYAETWIVDASNNPGYVHLRNRHWKDGQYPVCLDIQDTLAGGPSDPGFDAPVGTSRCDGSGSQEWKLISVGSGTNAYYLENYVSDDRMTWRGTGYDPAYVQRPAGSLGEKRFVIKVL